jgi:FkbM family methyltransferase
VANHQADNSERIDGTGPGQRVIYDFGANNGDDIPYYLKKADVVVAVEANPVLCREIEERFATELGTGKLRIENCVLTDEGSDPEVYFYLHKRRHVLGQFPPPAKGVIDNYTKTRLPSQSVKQILQKHGSPHYIKIDLEGYDEVILRDILQNGFRPPFISAEFSSIQILALLAGLGDYKAFKLVEGATVHKEYRSHMITVDGARELYEFPPHSAGPFGDDIKGDWMNADDLFEGLTMRKTGWRDVHATNLIQIDGESRAEKSRLMRRHFKGWLGAKFRSRHAGK